MIKKTVGIIGRGFRSIFSLDPAFSDKELWEDSLEGRKKRGWRK